MKKSTYVPASLIVALAATVTVTGCSGRQRCVDAMGRTIPDQACRDGSVPGAHFVSSGGFGSSGSRGYYGGSSSSGGFFGG